MIKVETGKETKQPLGAAHHLFPQHHQQPTTHTATAAGQNTISTPTKICYQQPTKITNTTNKNNHRLLGTIRRICICIIFAKAAARSIFQCQVTYFFLCNSTNLGSVIADTTEVQQHKKRFGGHIGSRTSDPGVLDVGGII